ncbi:polysaccharide deacetylase family protein [Sphingomonas sp. PAMC 26621]|uniref:polysaccharide deacetylase family protein n=1 Tax=Sphingomonas sp. PAMC 26621 TaxID=1112213 RepID=UPI00028A0F57|nr:polysaccharide deacetylase family protein [Sphingomonas sp. PAMC 26621]
MADRVVAITFDDLPYASGASDKSAKAAINAQRRIVQALRRADVPATGFVNEDKVEALGPAGPRLLAEWNRGLLALGNHGYSHFDSNDLDAGNIEREVVKGEATIRPMAASAGRAIPFFRFPYNHIGDTEPKRAAIERLLADHGYRLAASTIDTSDYLFNNAYERAFAKHDRAMMRRIERAYLDHSRVQIAYYGELGRKVFGRKVPAIMLLHANRLNAATIQPLLGLFRSGGYRFVSLTEAQSDPAYSTPVAATKFGPMWAYRWARAQQVKVNGRLEQEPPAWVGTYADETP